MPQRPVRRPEPQPEPLPAVAAYADVSLQQAVQDWRQSHVAAGLSRNTQKSYAGTMEMFARWLALQGIPSPMLAELNTARVRAYITGMMTSGEYKPTTVRSRTIAIKIFARWCADEGFIREENPLGRVKNPKAPQKTSKPFTREEVAALLEAAARSRNAIRDTAMMMLMLATGLRAAEVSGLRVDELDLDRRRVKTLGKGAKERAVAFDEVTSAAMRRWLAARDSERTEVFLSAKGLPISGQTLYGILSRLGAIADVKNTRPHRFRDTFAATFADAHPDRVFQLQGLLGHEALAMSMRYARTAQAVHEVDGASVLDHLGVTAMPEPESIEDVMTTLRGEGYSVQDIMRAVRRSERTVRRVLHPGRAS